MNQVAQTSFEDHGAVLPKPTFAAARNLGNYGLMADLCRAGDEGPVPEKSPFDAPLANWRDADKGGENGLLCHPALPHDGSIT